MKGELYSISIVSLFLIVGFIGICEIVPENLNAEGPTEVSGIYFTDTTWTLSESPYIVIGDVQIVNEATLTIEAGVNVQYSGAYEILIKGTIIADGEVSNPIIFSSSSDEATSGAMMLMFKDTNLSHSSLSHLVMEDSHTSVKVGEESEHDQGEKNNGTLTMNHVKFSDTIIITDGYDTNAKLVLIDAEIRSSTIRGTYPRSEEIIIKDSEISNSNIKSDSYNKGITIRDSIVTDSNFTIGCSPANIHIIDSEIQSSDFREGGGSPVIGPLEITNSKIVNTPINLPVVRLEVLNSIICYSGLNGIIFGNGFFENSLIVGGGQGVALNITGHNGYTVHGSILVSNSTIAYNLIGIRINDFYEISIENNNIIENALYNVENLAFKDVAAQNNYWGSDNDEEIGKLIFDYYDDINYGKVLSNQFLTEPMDFDSDKDGVKDSIDTDDDDDGYLDDEDEFPLDPTRWSEKPEDDTPDDDTPDDDTPDDDINVEMDTDGDGHLDSEDAFSMNINEWLDTDEDGLGNNEDMDDDDDGHLDEVDAYPLDKRRWVESNQDSSSNWMLIAIIEAAIIGTLLIVILITNLKGRGKKPT